jgi:hypothetical protein
VIAATRLDRCLPDGPFLLGFSRPLGVQRFCGVWNRGMGTIMASHVVAVHQGEGAGRRKTAVERVDPYCKELRRLWRQHHPGIRPAPSRLVDALRVDADVAAQFPGDARLATAARTQIPITTGDTDA